MRGLSLELQALLRLEQEGPLPYKDKGVSILGYTRMVKLGDSYLKPDDWHQLLLRLKELGLVETTRKKVGPHLSAPKVFNFNPSTLAVSAKSRSLTFYRIPKAGEYILREACL